MHGREGSAGGKEEDTIGSYQIALISQCSQGVRMPPAWDHYRQFCVAVHPGTWTTTHHYQPGTTTNVSRGMTGASRDVDGHHDMLTGRSKTTQNIDDARNEMGAIT